MPPHKRDLVKPGDVIWVVVSGRITQFVAGDPVGDDHTLRTTLTMFGYPIAFEWGNVFLCEEDARNHARTGRKLGGNEDG